MKNNIITAIYDALDALSEQNPLSQNKIIKNLNASLYGSESSLDSLELVNFVVILEKIIEERFSQYISIADDRALSQDVSPFSTIQSLADYIEMIIKENIK